MHNMCSIHAPGHCAVLLVLLNVTLLHWFSMKLAIQVDVGAFFAGLPALPTGHFQPFL